MIIKTKEIILKELEILLNILSKNSVTNALLISAFKSFILAFQDAVLEASIEANVDNAIFEYEKQCPPTVPEVKPIFSEKPPEPGNKASEQLGFSEIRLRAPWVKE